MIIRKLDLDDTLDILEIEKNCFSHPWSKKSISESIISNNYIFFGIEFNSRIIAYGGLNIICDESYITNIATLPAYRNQGLARKILNAIIENSEKMNCAFISLEVRENNYVAINLYKKVGFQIVGKRNNFYSNPKENANIMTKYFEEKI